MPLPNEVPIYWGCGLTALAALKRSGIFPYHPRRRRHAGHGFTQQSARSLKGRPEQPDPPAIKLTHKTGPFPAGKAFVSMDRARVLKVNSSQREAMTAGTTGMPTGDLDTDIELKLAVVNDGDMVNLKGGLPIVVDSVASSTSWRR